MKRIIFAFAAAFVLNSCDVSFAAWDEQTKLQEEEKIRREVREEMAGQGTLKVPDPAVWSEGEPGGEVKINSEESAKVDELVAQGKAVKARGLYLGMSMGHARAQVAKLFNIPPPRIMEANYGPNKCIITNGDDFGVGADKSDMKVDYIALNAKIFNVKENTNIEAFVQAFMNNNHIREMKKGMIPLPGGEEELGYFYESPEGYIVVIFARVPLVLIQSSAK